MFVRKSVFFISILVTLLIFSGCSSPVKIPDMNHGVVKFVYNNSKDSMDVEDESQPELPDIEYICLKIYCTENGKTINIKEKIPKNKDLEFTVSLAENKSYEFYIFGLDGNEMSNSYSFIDKQSFPPNKVTEINLKMSPVTTNYEVSGKTYSKDIIDVNWDCIPVKITVSSDNISKYIERYPQELYYTFYNFDFWEEGFYLWNYYAGKLPYMLTTSKSRYKVLKEFEEIDPNEISFETHIILPVKYVADDASLDWKTGSVDLYTFIFDSYKFGTTINLKNLSEEIKNSAEK